MYVRTAAQSYGLSILICEQRIKAENKQSYKQL